MHCICHDHTYKLKNATAVRTYSCAGIGAKSCIYTGLGWSLDLAVPSHVMGVVESLVDTSTSSPPAL
jgi:hypothetical protein